MNEKPRVKCPYCDKYFTSKGMPNHIFHKHKDKRHLHPRHKHKPMKSSEEWQVIQDEMEPINFNNVIHFNRKELRQIIGGARALDVLTRHMSLSLGRYGILEHKHMKGGRKNRGNHTFVTPRAIKVLDSFKEDETE